MHKSTANNICKTQYIANEFMSRVQVDLIDLRTRPDGDYKYTAHARDHFTRFSWAAVLKNK